VQGLPPPQGEEEMSRPIAWIRGWDVCTRKERKLIEAALKWWLERGYLSKLDTVAFCHSIGPVWLERQRKEKKKP